MKKGKWLVFLVLFLLLAAAGIAVFGMILPIRSARSAMEMTGKLTLCQQEDNSWLLTWPEAEKAGLYRVELLQNNKNPGEEPKLLLREYARDGARLSLPQLPENMELLLRISSGVEFRTILGENVRFSEEPREAAFHLENMDLNIQDFAVDGDEKTVRMDVEPSGAVRWQYRLVDAADAVLEENVSEAEKLLLQFGEGTSLPVPEAGADYRLYARTCWENEDLMIYGKQSNPFRVTHDSLQLRQANPRLTVTAKNTVSITWEETKASGYAVQLLDEASGTWNTLRRLSAGENRQFTDCLEPGKEYQYRLVSLDESGAEYMISDTMTAQGRDRVQYATVWPVRDLPAYSSPSGGKRVETAMVSTAYCVLEEVNDMFAVRINDQICYIDANSCMINLPEYLGGLCSYNITNSVYAIYAVHEFAIPQVTGVVTEGYSDVCQEDGTYLVPLLYPVARRLLKAAKTALEQGYRLKIYDSFRPYVATRSIFDLTLLIMEDGLPDKTYTDIPKTELELPPPRGGSGELTYGWLMTGTNYEIDSFLAKTTSAHNLGIALDLTLEKADTGDQLEMQTAMHDLSHFSVVPENNENAELLGKIMHGAGFGGLISEWWHFQDNQARRDYSPPAVINGVSAEGWRKDDTGWKYRTAKGGWYAGETAEISGKTYTFDANGYVME